VAGDGDGLLSLRDLAREKRTHGSLQDGSFVESRLPNHLEIHAEIIMDQLVSHTRHFTPGQSWISALQVRWKPLGGFSDDLESSDDGKVSFSSVENSSKVIPAMKLCAFSRQYTMSCRKSR
jgi:hypothetical protein